MAGGREVQVVYDQLRPRERPQVSTRFRTSCEVGACIRWCDAVWSWREASTRAQVLIAQEEIQQQSAAVLCILKEFLRHMAAWNSR